MEYDWKFWLKQYNDDILSPVELWGYAIPCIDRTNVDAMLSALPPKAVICWRELAHYSDPEVSSNSAWPPGPPSPEIREGIVAVKEWFASHPDVCKSSGPAP